MAAIDSLLRANMAQWGPVQEAVLSILGTTATIMHMGDPHAGLPDATTFKTIGAEQVTFTWSEPWRAFDGHTQANAGEHAPYIFQGIIPVIDFNGTDEEADSPDIAYFSVDDSGNAGFSVGAWINVTNTASRRTILSKHRGSSTTLREWFLGLDSDDDFELRLTDESAGVQCVRLSDVVATHGVWTFLVATYDGTGGSTAANGITLYVDGAVRASTATNNGSYVAMENLACLVMVGSQEVNVQPFDGKMAGGPLGPWFVTHNAAGIITADKIGRLYDLHHERAGLGLRRWRHRRTARPLRRTDHAKSRGQEVPIHGGGPGIRQALCEEHWQADD